MTGRQVLRALDVSTVTAVIAIAFGIAYLESRGGFGNWLAQVGIDRRPRVAVSSTPTSPQPPVAAPATPSTIGDPFLQPIEASMGWRTPFIPPMSATGFGAIPISSADLQDPAKAALYARSSDGFVFVSLPDRPSSGVRLQAGARPVTQAATTPVPDVFHSLAAWLFPTGEPTPRRAAVS